VQGLCGHRESSIVELQRELPLAWNVIGECAENASCDSGAIHAGIWIREVRVICEVERFGAKLHIRAEFDVVIAATLLQLLTNWNGFVLNQLAVTAVDAEGVTEFEQ